MVLKIVQLTWLRSGACNSPPGIPCMCVCAFAGILRTWLTAAGLKKEKCFYFFCSSALCEFPEVFIFHQFFRTPTSGNKNLASSWMMSVYVRASLSLSLCLCEKSTWKSLLSLETNDLFLSLSLSFFLFLAFFLFSFILLFELLWSFSLYHSL